MNASTARHHLAITHAWRSMSNGDASPATVRDNNVFRRPDESGSARLFWRQANGETVFRANDAELRRLHPAATHA